MNSKDDTPNTDERNSISKVNEEQVDWLEKLIKNLMKSKFTKPIKDIDVGPYL